MTQRILVGADGSENSRRAIEWCAEFARDSGVEVVVCHVVSKFGEWMLSAGQIDFQKVEKERLELVTGPWTEPLRAAAVPYQVVQVSGDPVTELLAVAESKDVELNVSFDWEVEVLGQFTSSQETLFLSIVYERESDGAMTQLGGATKKVYVMRDVTETFSAAGRYSYQVFAPISVASGSSKSDRFRFKLRMSVSDENIEYSVRDIRMHRLVEI